MASASWQTGFENDPTSNNDAAQLLDPLFLRFTADLTVRQAWTATRAGGSMVQGRPILAEVGRIDRAVSGPKSGLVVLDSDGRFAVNEESPGFTV